MNSIKQKIAVLCSGSGSNAEKIFDYFKNHPTIEVSLLLANTPTAYALVRAEQHQVPTLVFNKNEFQEGVVLQKLIEQDISWVILAGFLWLIPESYVAHYQNRMINIHPALLPKFGGKGMYGAHVHHAVVAQQEKETGITIHFVNAHYDEGNSIFQASCEVTSEDTPETVAKKVQALEHQHFPVVIEKTILNSGI